MGSVLGHGESHIHLGEVRHQTRSRLALSLFLTLGFTVLEAVAGLLANSLALMTDAAHNLTDVMALGLGWYAVRLTGQPSNPQKTYGYHRAGILVALANSTTLVLISLGVFYEAYWRLLSAPPVRSQTMIVVGAIAFAVNIATAWLVRRRGDRDLNLRALFLHLMGDVASTLGAVAAGVLIHFTGANWLDPVVSVLIGCLIVYTAWGILRETVEILLESTPPDVNLSAMVNDIMSVEGVLGVHDLHVWSLTRQLRTMSAHLLTEDAPISTGTRIQEEVSELVGDRYNISHATLQLEAARDDPDSLYCDIEGVVHARRR